MKSIKKIFLMLMVSMLCFTTAFGSIADAISFKGGIPVLTRTGTTATVSVDFTDVDGLTGDVQMIVIAENKNTGKIDDIAIDKKAVSTEVTLEATVDVTDDDEVRYYVTTGNGASLKNVAPKGISNFKGEPKFDCVRFTWDRAFDDFGDLTYVLYKVSGDEKTEIARTTSNTFRLEAAELDARYKFGVEVIDSTFAGPINGNPDPAGYSLVEDSYIDFSTDPDTSTGVEFYSNCSAGADGFCVQEEFQGRESIRGGDKTVASDAAAGYSKSTIGMMYFNPDPELITADVKDVAVTVDYFDAPGVSMSVLYNDDGNKYPTVGGFTATGTNTWKKHTFFLTNANLTGSTVLGQNHKLRIQPSKNLHISRVSIVPTSYFDAEPTEAPLVPPANFKIHVMSDSIAAGTGGNTVGWGNVFSNYLYNVQVKNSAVAGASTKTFNWTNAMSAVNDGDYVFVCFGHNDSMTGTERATTVEEYTANMTARIKEIKAKGATPIILTSIPQYSKTANYMSTEDGIKPYRVAAKAVADAENVAFYDTASAMYDRFMGFYKGSEDAAFREFYNIYADDTTHLLQDGADLLSKLIVKGIYNISSLKGLKPYLNVEKATLSATPTPGPTEDPAFDWAADQALVSSKAGTLKVKTLNSDCTQILDASRRYGYYANRYGRSAFISTVDTNVTDVTLYVLGYRGSGTVNFATGGTMTTASNLSDSTIDTTKPLMSQWGTEGRDYVMTKRYENLPIKDGHIVCDFYAGDSNGNYFVKDVYVFETSKVTPEIDAAMKSRLPKPSPTPTPVPSVDPTAPTMTFDQAVSKALYSTTWGTLTSANDTDSLDKRLYGKDGYEYIGKDKTAVYKTTDGTWANEPVNVYTIIKGVGDGSCRAWLMGSGSTNWSVVAAPKNVNDQFVAWTNQTMTSATTLKFGPYAEPKNSEKTSGLYVKGVYVYKKSDIDADPRIEAALKTMGAENATPAPTATATSAPTATPELTSFVDFSTDPDTDGGAVFFYNANAAQDGYSKEVEKGGRQGRRAANKTLDEDFAHPRVENGFLYFSPNKDVVSSDERNVAVVVDYYDEANMTATILYCTAPDGKPTARATSLTTTGTNTWKRHTFYLTNTLFDGEGTGLGNNDKDFRIEASPGFTISRVEIVPTSSLPTVEPTKAPTVESTKAPTVEPTKAPTTEPTKTPTATPTSAPTSAPTVNPFAQSFVDFSTDPDTDGGARFFYDANTAQDGYSKEVEKGGKQGRRAANKEWDTDFVHPKVSNGFLYFSPDTDVVSSDERNVAVTIEYYDEAGMTANLIYCNAPDGKPVNGADVLTTTGTNTWKTYTFYLTDALFDGTGTGLGDGTYDLRINATPGFTVSKASILPASLVPTPAPTDEPTPTPEAKTRIFLAGDSTCEILPANNFPREGWGMEIGQFFKSNVEIVNKSKGGKSTRTFLQDFDATAGASGASDTRLADIAAQAQDGDYLFVMLGCNDALNGRDTVKTDPTKTTDDGDYTSYRQNILRFKTFAEENGLKLVMMTPLHVLKAFDSEGNMGADGIEAHRAALLEVCAANNITVLDIASAHKAMLESFGYEKAKPFFMMLNREDYPDLPDSVPTNDSTHLSQAGALAVSKMIINAIKDNASLADLYSLVDTTKDITIPAPEAEPDAIYLATVGGAGKVTLRWSKNFDKDNVTYIVKRDGEPIAELTDKGGYIDTVDAGTYTYQIVTADVESNTSEATATASVSTDLTFDEAAAKAILSTQKGTFDVKCYKDNGTLIDFTKNYPYAADATKTHWANRYGSAIFVPNIDIEETGITLYVVGFKNTGSVQFATGGGVPQAINSLQGTRDDTYPINAQWGSEVEHDYVMRGDYPTLTAKTGEMVCDFRAADANGNYYIKDVYAFKTSDVTDEIDAAMRSIGESGVTYPDGASMTVADGVQVNNGVVAKPLTGGDGKLTLEGDHILLGPAKSGSGVSVPNKPRFNIDDSYIYGNEPIMVEVEYSTTEATEMSIGWNCGGNDFRSKASSIVNDGEKHTVRFFVEISDSPLFSNNYEATGNAADFTISGMTDKNINVYKVSVFNANHFPVGNT